MKLNKWLITLPIVASAAPIVATATSCSSIKGVDLDGDCAKYVEVASCKKYKKGGTCEFQIQVKNEFVNEYFLPDDISYIICGDQIVFPYLEAEDDTWFVYEVDESHTWANIYVNNTPGKAKIDFSLETIVGVNVSFIDPFETKAFFEEDEAFNTDEMVVSLELSDESEIFIDKSYYHVDSSKYPAKPVVGTSYPFTISYQGKKEIFKSAEMTAKCIAKNSVVRFNDERYTSLDLAIDAYNKLNTTGTYSIRLDSGDYKFDNELTINQNLEGKKLIITGLNVSLSSKIVGDNETNLFTIKNTDNVDNASVTFLNLTFNQPNVSGTLSKSHNFINANKANGVILNYCALNGIKGENSKYINAIKTTEAKNISISSCTSNFINTYITGSITHYETEKENYDVVIDDCEANNQISIEQISGNTLFNFIGNTDAQLFYTKDESTKSNLESAINLNGDGKIIIRGCNLTQLRQTNKDAWFIKVLGSGKDANRKIVVQLSQFNHFDEETTFKDFYNYSQYVWTVQYITESKDVNSGEKINFYE